MSIADRFQERILMDGEKKVCSGCGLTIRGGGSLYFFPISNSHRILCVNCKEEEEDQLASHQLLRDIFGER